MHLELQRVVRKRTKGDVDGVRPGEAYEQLLLLVICGHYSGLYYTNMIFCPKRGDQYGIQDAYEA
jgi:hypothetical protein